MSSEQDKVAKKKKCMFRGERSDHIFFRAESIFLNIALRSLNTAQLRFAQPKCPFG